MDNQKKYKGIQVIGQQHYPESRWREAILSYLFGIWKMDHYFCSRPKISFGGHVLRLISSNQFNLTNNARYVAYYELKDMVLQEDRPDMDDDNILYSSDSQRVVELNLVRFVKNESIRMLVIYFEQGSKGRLSLWKKSKRGQYGVNAQDVYSSMMDIPELNSN